MSCVPFLLLLSKMYATIEFDGDDHINMQTENGSMQFERIAHLPLNAAEMKRVANNPAGVLCLKSVEMIAEFERTGVLPEAEVTGVFLSSPELAEQRKDARKSQSIKNLTQIIRGVLDYQEAHGGLFPAAHTEERLIDGKATRVNRSWRVAILPFIGQQQLYDQFHLDEDWDSPHNLNLLNQMPDVFRAPNATIESTVTPYLALIGPNTVISTTSTAMNSVNDGTAKSTVLIETRNMVPWTKPEDINIEADGDLRMLTPIYEIFLIAKANGTTAFLAGDTEEEELRTLFNRDVRD